MVVIYMSSVFLCQLLWLSKIVELVLIPHQLTTSYYGPSLYIQMQNLPFSANGCHYKPSLVHNRPFRNLGSALEFMGHYVT